MNTKLTLTIEKDVIKEAKMYAKERGRSLSDIIESYLKAITNSNGKKIKTTPVVQSLKGSFTLPDEVDYKTELAKGLEEKYL